MRPDFGEEPLVSQDGRQFRMQDLERDVPPVPEVAGEIDGRHPAAPDHALDAIPAGERRAEA